MKNLLLLLSSLLFIFCAGCSDYGTQKNFGNIQVYYKGDISETQATRVGNYLVEQGWDNNDTKKSVQLVKEGKTYQFRMVVKKGLEQDEEYTAKFKMFARELSNEIFDGAPVEIHACDDRLRTLRVFLMKH